MRKKSQENNLLLINDDNLFFNGGTMSKKVTFADVFKWMDRARGMDEKS